MGRVIGIDLGTTNTAVAVILNDRPKVLEDERGYKVLPSCLSAKGDGRFIVGHAAYNLILTRPGRTVYATKRLIGRRFDSPEVTAARKRMQYQIREAPDGGVQVQVGDAWMTPTEVAAIILQVVKSIAERALGEAVESCIITVPAYFNHAQRQATLEAAGLAGMRCERLLNEPTAAALAYGFRRNENRTIVIFDLGGGTFDVSILRIGDGLYETLATMGDTYLGGEDFDFRIVDHLAEHFQKKTGLDLRADRHTLQRLKDAAERAKCELSFAERTIINVPHVTPTDNLELTFTRATLESLTGDLIQRCVDVTRRAVQEAGISVTEIDEVVLVGGQSRMPKLREAVARFFGRDPSRAVHPEEAVAVGASVHASSLDDPDAPSAVLLDVTPFDLGIDSAGGMFSAVVQRNARVPCTETRTFVTARDHQDQVRIVVRQGSSRQASENEFLGEFVLTGLTLAPRFQTRVDVTFRLDSNGILHVGAVEKGTNERRQIVIRNYAQRAITPSMPSSDEAAADRERRQREDALLVTATPDAAEARPASQPAPTEVKKKAGFFDMLFGRKPTAPAVATAAGGAGAASGAAAAGAAAAGAAAAGAAAAGAAAGAVAAAGAAATGAAAGAVAAAGAAATGAAGAAGAAAAAGAVSGAGDARAEMNTWAAPDEADELPSIDLSSISLPTLDGHDTLVPSDIVEEEPESSAPASFGLAGGGISSDPVPSDRAEDPFLMDTPPDDEPLLAADLFGLDEEGVDLFADAPAAQPGATVVAVTEVEEDGAEADIGGIDVSGLDGDLDGGIDVSGLDGDLDGGIDVSGLDGGLDGGIDVSGLDGGLDGGIDVSGLDGGLEGGSREITLSDDLFDAAPRVAAPAIVDEPVVEGFDTAVQKSADTTSDFLNLDDLFGDIEVEIASAAPPVAPEPVRSPGPPAGVERIAAPAIVEEIPFDFDPEPPAAAPPSGRGDAIQNIAVSDLFDDEPTGVHEAEQDLSDLFDAAPAPQPADPFAQQSAGGSGWEDDPFAALGVDLTSPLPAAGVEAAPEPAALEPAALEPAALEPAALEPAEPEPAEPAALEPAWMTAFDAAPEPEPESGMRVAAPAIVPEPESGMRVAAPAIVPEPGEGMRVAAPAIVPEPEPEDGIRVAAPAIVPELPEGMVIGGMPGSEFPEEDEQTPDAPLRRGGAISSSPPKIHQEKSDLDGMPDLPESLPAPLRAENPARKPARIKLNYRRFEVFVSEYRENMRKGGTFIKTEKPLAVGRECVFEVKVPGVTDPVLLDAVVSWVQDGSSGERGMGVEYRMDERQRLHVERLLRGA